MKKIGRLHILTDIVLQDRFSHADLTNMAITGGADIIQFRQKTGSTLEMIEVAKQMKALCLKAGVTFIVNDRIDVAMACEADGVHLGQDDFPAPLARKFLGDDKIIGGSASTIEEAKKCLSDGVDYIGFGPVYPTSSKHDAGPASGLTVLKQIVQEIPLPIIAIGGVDVNNVFQIMDAGAHGIAVISAVCFQDNPEEATRILYQALS
jgi:thiamine-phosphate pyrophosphorylase